MIQRTLGAVRSAHDALERARVVVVVVVVVQRQVIKEKKWREVASAFNLPSTCTSGSYTLRKTYVKLLHDYEQVYFFNARGKPVPPPLPLLGNSSHAGAHRGIDSSAHEEDRGVGEASGTGFARRVPSELNAIIGSSAHGEDRGVGEASGTGFARRVPSKLKALIGTQISGSVDGRFDRAIPSASQ